MNALLGGWAISGVGMYQSGFPIAVVQANNNSNLLGSGQRPNLVPGIDPKLPGSPEDNYDPVCACIPWLNPAAWSAAAPFTFGNAPRADTRVRTPLRTNWDLAVHKALSLGFARLTIRAEAHQRLRQSRLRGAASAFRSGGCIRHDCRRQWLPAYAAIDGEGHVVEGSTARTLRRFSGSLVPAGWAKSTAPAIHGSVGMSPSRHCHLVSQPTANASDVSSSKPGPPASCRTPTSSRSTTSELPTANPTSSRSCSKARICASA